MRLSQVTKADAKGSTCKETRGFKAQQGGCRAKIMLTKKCVKQAARANLAGMCL